MGNKITTKPSEAITNSLPHTKKAEDIADEGSISNKKIYASKTNRVLTNNTSFAMDRTQPINLTRKFESAVSAKHPTNKSKDIQTSTAHPKKQIKIQLNTTFTNRESIPKYDLKTGGNTVHPKYKNLKINIPEDTNTTTGQNRIEQCLSTKHSVSYAKPLNFKECNHHDNISGLPPMALANIMLFTIEGFRRYLCVNPTWYISIKAAFDMCFNVIENQFVSVYSKYLCYRNSYTSSSLLTFTNKPGMRIDRCIIFENVNVPDGYSFKFGYEFVYQGEKMKYKAEFEFDCVNKKLRQTWIYQTLNYGEGQTISQHTIQVPINDCGEIAINIYSLRGLINLDSFKWTQPGLYKTPYRSLFRDKKAERYYKTFSDLNRVCELEDFDMSWYDINYIANKNAYSIVNLANLKKHFSVISIEFAGMDCNIVKATLRACKVGI